MLFFSLISEFIYFWLQWVFVAAHELSFVMASEGAAIHCGGQASYCSGFSLQSMHSRAQGLSCSEAHGIFPDQEPVSPVVAGRFLFTAPPGKSRFFLLKWKVRSLGKITKESFVRYPCFCLEFRRMCGFAPLSEDLLKVKE